MSALIDLIKAAGISPLADPPIETSIYWWSVVMRKNMPGMPKPNPIGGEHLYVAAIGRHDAKSRDALVSGTGMTPSDAFDKALERLAAGDFRRKRQKKRASDVKAEDDTGAGRSKKPGTGRRSRAHSKYKRQRLQAET